jgi:tetratricopeptide (TPR) repeat protein
MSLPAMTPNAQQVFEQASHMHQQGCLAEAESLLLTVIQQIPAHAEALRLLGVIALQSRRPENGLAWIERALAVAPEHPVCHSNRGAALLDLQRPDEAMESFGRATALKPDYAAAHSNHGIALSRLERFEEAEASYRRAIALQPELADAQANLGATLCKLGRWDEAVASCNRALELRPAFPPALNSRGQALLALGRSDEAQADFRLAIAVHEDFVEAHRGLAQALRLQGGREAAIGSYAIAVALDAGDAETWSRYGDVLQALGRYEEAIDCYSRALNLQPEFAGAYFNRSTARMKREDYSDALSDLDQVLRIRPEFLEALSNRGVVLTKLRRFEEGILCFRKALELGPEDALIHINLAGTLSDNQQYEDCVSYCNKALEYQPNLPDALHNRGVALHELYRFEEASADLARCMARDPDHVDAHWAQGITQLTLGHFEQGWPLYEWRKKVAKAEQLPPGTVWSGREHVVGKTVVIHSEQGLGDTLHFIRYARLLRGRGAQVTAVVQAPLLSLLRHSDPHTTYVTADQTPAHADFRCSLMSLPLAFDTRADTIPAWPSYLRADAVLIEGWARKLKPRTRPRIGLAWSGNTATTIDHKRSLLLEQLKPMLSFPADWYVVQKGIRDTDADTLACLPQLINFGDELGDFANTAALMDQLDLIITVDTSLGHLAGALGKPVWILLPQVPEWRWQLEREDSPWYPSVRLFRQPARGDWVSVIARLSDELAERTW